MLPDLHVMSVQLNAKSTNAHNESLVVIFKFEKEDKRTGSSGTVCACVCVLGVQELLSSQYVSTT